VPRLLLRLSGTFLVVYGLVGLAVAVLLLWVGNATFTRVLALTSQLDTQRVAVAGSLDTVATTLADTGNGTQGIQQSVDEARQAALAASQLAAQTAATFDATAQGMNVQIFGLQPFAQVIPQLQSSSVQLQQLSGVLSSTGDALAANNRQISQVSADLNQLEQELHSASSTLRGATALTSMGAALMPLELAFYGLCVVVIMQSLFGILLGMLLVSSRARRAVRWTPGAHHHVTQHLAEPELEHHPPRRAA
jgi:hypothetical protein